MAAAFTKPGAVDVLGTIDGKTCHRYTLRTHRGVEVNLSNFGARVLSLSAPDRNGIPAGIVTGYSSFEDLQADPSYMGCTVGRYANRIAGSKFEIDGAEYSVAANEGDNCLHGGPGIHKEVWECTEATNNSVTFAFCSPDGAGGFPGNLDMTVHYQVSEDGCIRIDYVARTDKKTVINLTNHAYFNLAGVGTRDVLDHELVIPARKYLPVDEKLIPTGAIDCVIGTPYDFTSPRKIGERFSQLPRGYDTCFVLDEEDDGKSVTIVARDPFSGRILEVRTTQPGVQLYTAYHFDSDTTHGIGGKYPRFGAFCLETQDFPNAPNQKNFPSPVLNPGDEYRHTTTWKFSAQ